MNIKKLGGQLTKSRLECGYSQSDLAKKVGVSRQAIQKIESCESLPGLNLFCKLAVVLETSAYHLLGFPVCAYHDCDNSVDFKINRKWCSGTCRSRAYQQRKKASQNKIEY